MAKLSRASNSPEHEHRMAILKMAVEAIASPEMCKYSEEHIKERIKAVVDQLSASYNEL